MGSYYFTPFLGGRALTHKVMIFWIISWALNENFQLILGLEDLISLLELQACNVFAEQASLGKEQ